MMMLSSLFLTSAAWAEEHPWADRVSDTGVSMAMVSGVWLTSGSSFLVPQWTRGDSGELVWLLLVLAPSAILFEASVPVTLTGGMAGVDAGQARWAGATGWGLYGAHLGLGLGVALCERCEDGPAAAMAVGSLVSLGGAFALGVVQSHQNHADARIPMMMVPLFQKHW